MMKIPRVLALLTLFTLIQALVKVDSCSKSTISCGGACQGYCRSPFNLPWVGRAFLIRFLQRKYINPCGTDRTFGSKLFLRVPVQVRVPWNNPGSNRQSRSTRSARNTNYTIVYRTLRSDENPARGIIAKDPSARKTIQSHVGCGCRPGYKSQYISSTKDYDVAVHYGRNNRIVSINVAMARRAGCQVIDISDGGDLAQLAHNFARCSKEVLFTGATIPPEAIRIIRD